LALLLDADFSALIRALPRVRGLAFSFDF